MTGYVALTKTAIRDHFARFTEISDGCDPVTLNF